MVESGARRVNLLNNLNTHSLRSVSWFLEIVVEYCVSLRGYTGLVLSGLLLQGSLSLADILHATSCAFYDINYASGRTCEPLISSAMG
ncbi:unnamed protein product [Gongylonema pulchrum]|uniref:Ovule protein n=1 Tax=Gongylonema pulchrum TaxID=637853 RepID=A0A183EAD9_9BILA|nr:unnamed protein product [Gongylonema pulchrum]